MRFWPGEAVRTAGVLCAVAGRVVATYVADAARIKSSAAAAIIALMLTLIATNAPLAIAPAGPRDAVDPLTAAVTVAATDETTCDGAASTARVVRNAPS